MQTPRKRYEILRGKIDFKKAILLRSPRQVGKTTLVKSLAEKLNTDFYISMETKSL